MGKDTHPIGNVDHFFLYQYFVVFSNVACSLPPIDSRHVQFEILINLSFLYVMVVQLGLRYTPVN